MTKPVDNLGGVFLDALPIGVCVLDQARTILFCNELLAIWCGIPAAQAVGQSFAAVFPPLADAEFEPRLAQVFEHEFPEPSYPLLQEDLFSDRGPRVCRVTFEPRNVDRERRVVMGVVDHTQSAAAHEKAERASDREENERTLRERTEERLSQQQKTDSLNVLVGGIAHDFNNFLGMIMGHAQLSRMRAPKGADISKNMKEIESACRRATTLAQQLLSYSKGSGPTRQTVSTSELIRETVEFDLSGSNIRSVLHVQPDLWLAHADQSQVSQVLDNLVINAKQAMPKGGELLIKASNVLLENEQPPLKAGCYINLHVQDNGPGMAPEVRDHIFEVGFTTKPTGNGLGLAVTHSIIKKYNGHITVDSAPDRGTTFSVFLPAAPGTLAPVVKREHFKTVRSARILVMDDEEGIRMLLREMLKLIGYESVLVADGKEALEEYKRATAEHTPYDVVVLDLTVPGGFGGLKVMTELVKLNPTVKAVVSSGYVERDEMQNYAKFGFAAAIEKPYNLADLKHTLGKVLAVETHKGEQNE